MAHQNTGPLPQLIYTGQASMIRLGRAFPQSLSLRQNPKISIAVIQYAVVNLSGRDPHHMQALPTTSAGREHDMGPRLGIRGWRVQGDRPPNLKLRLYPAEKPAAASLPLMIDR